MAQIRLSHGKWTALVNAAGTASAAVPNLSGAAIQSTTSARFRKFEDLQNQINTVAEQERAVASVDTGKMLQVGDNVVRFDESTAGQIERNS